MPGKKETYENENYTSGCADGRGCHVGQRRSQLRLLHRVPGARGRLTAGGLCATRRRGPKPALPRRRLRLDTGLLGGLSDRPRLGRRRLAISPGLRHVWTRPG